MNKREWKEALRGFLELSRENRALKRTVKRWHASFQVVQKQNGENATRVRELEQELKQNRAILERANERITELEQEASELLGASFNSQQRLVLLSRIETLMGLMEEWCEGDKEDLHDAIDRVISDLKKEKKALLEANRVLSVGRSAATVHQSLLAAVVGEKV
jgi:chromosome segregation ATPase